MPRHRKTDRPVRILITLPQSLDAKIRLHLWSSVRQGIPPGALQEFFMARCEEYFARLPPATTTAAAAEGERSEP